MYECPEAFGTDDNRHEIDLADIEACKESGACQVLRETPCDEDMFELCVSEMARQGMDSPNNPQEALLLYHRVRPIVRPLISEPADDWLCHAVYEYIIYSVFANVVGLEKTRG